MHTLHSADNVVEEAHLSVCLSVCYTLAYVITVKRIIKFVIVLS